MAAGSPTGRGTGDSLTGPEQRGTGSTARASGGDDITFPERWDAPAIAFFKRTRDKRGRKRGVRGLYFYEPEFREDTTNAYDAGKSLGPLETELIGGTRVAKQIAGPTRQLLARFRRRFPKAGKMIISGWRTNKKQFDLYEEWAEGRRKDVVAFPGTSNHQDGLALDLNVGSRASTYEFEHAGGTISWRETPQYRWMVENATQLSFIRTVESEPWHWEYRPQREQPFPLLPLGPG